MAAPKRTPTEREEALAETAKWDRRGYTLRAIAAKLGVTHQQVAYDLRIIRDRYRKATLAERGEAVAEKLDQLREVRAEAWDAWERSKDNKEKQVKEKVTEGGVEAGQQAERLKAIITTEGRLPENAYLQTVLKTLEEEAELLDLYPDKGPKKPLQVDVTSGGKPLDRNSLTPADIAAAAALVGMAGLGIPANGGAKPVDSLAQDHSP